MQSFGSVDATAGGPHEATSDEELCRKGAANFSERGMDSRRERLVPKTVAAAGTADCVDYSRNLITRPRLGQSEAVGIALEPRAANQ